MVCFLLPVQQAIGDHSDEERKIQSDDDNADNLHDEVARASEWATRFHDQGATAKELLTSMSLVTSWYLAFRHSWLVDGLIVREVNSLIG